jgi:hypothetical protein
MAATGEVAAAGAETGSVAVTGMQLTMQLDCGPRCPVAFSATSSGEIAGVNGTMAYGATWTSTSVSGTVWYGSSCIGPLSAGVPAVWDEAIIQPSTATIQGVQLQYGTSTYSGGTVTLSFGGTIVAGALAPATTQIDIAAGPVAITVVNQGIRGTMPIAPPIAPVPCIGSIQTFTADGTFLTLGAAAP